MGGLKGELLNVYLMRNFNNPRERELFLTVFWTCNPEEHVMQERRLCDLTNGRGEGGEVSCAVATPNDIFGNVYWDTFTSFVVCTTSYLYKTDRNLYRHCLTLDLTRKYAADVVASIPPVGRNCR